MKTISRILACVLCCLMILTACSGKTETPTDGTGASDPSGSQPAQSGIVYDKDGLDEKTTPVLMVRVNETYWKYIDLTPYLGQDNVWVRTDIDMQYLTDGINQIAVHSNAFNYGNRTDKSLDIYYSLCMDGAFDTFLSTDLMNTWELLADRYANIVLELKNKTTGEWETISYQPLFTQDESVVIGSFVPNDSLYNVCRNLTVESLAQYDAARVAVNMHVGTDLMQEPEPEEPDETDPGSPLDETTKVLKVKLNGAAPERYDLVPHLGEENIWVTVPLRFEKLKIGNNQIVIDSNVFNSADYCPGSVDVYFTLSSKGDSAVSQDGMVYWEQISDRVVNMDLQLHDAATGEWVSVTDDTYAQDTHTVIGVFNAGTYQTSFNMRRTFMLDSLAGFDDVRVRINLHVGSKINEEPDIQQPDVADPMDTIVPVLKANLNGSVYSRLDLTPYLGENDVWVTLPLDFSVMRSGVNRVILDSNVDNTGNFCDNSVDLYFTPGGKGDSAVSTDGRNTFVDFNDRVCNMYLELHNKTTGNWEKVGFQNDFTTTGEHTVIGYFSPSGFGYPFHMRRAFQIGNLEDYDDVRVCVNIHVGSDLALLP